MSTIEKGSPPAKDRRLNH